jgi:hypothetical protein
MNSFALRRSSTPACWRHACKALLPQRAGARPVRPRPSGRTTRYSLLPSTRALIAPRVWTRSRTEPPLKYAAPRAKERSPASFSSDASVISLAKGSLKCARARDDRSLALEPPAPDADQRSPVVSVGGPERPQVFDAPPPRSARADRRKVEPPEDLAQPHPSDATVGRQRVDESKRPRRTRVPEGSPVPRRRRFRSRPYSRASRNLEERRGSCSPTVTFIRRQPARCGTRSPQIRE